MAPAPDLSPTPLDGRWNLEVVRGRRPGQVFPLFGPETLLGSSPMPPSAGIDLAPQESPTSRRIQAQHASLAWTGAGAGKGPDGDAAPAIRDLDSEGGTFVNRRRVLPGQSLPLRDGDEIQLGAVVLRVNRMGEPPAKQAAETFAYAIEGGPTCRTWDEIVVASSQKWDALRDDVASGRVDRFVASVGRPDLRPRSALGSTADDRLDAWLCSLPTSRSFHPEADVHPARMVVAVTPGGGTLRRTVRVSNVGHCLLRAAARVEPPGLPWLKLDPAFADRAFTAVESVELALEIEVPEILPVPLVGSVVIEGNGGSAAVEVVVEPRREPDPELPPEPLPDPAAPASALAGWLARTPAGPAALLGAMVLGLARAGVAAAGPGLGGVAALFAAVGGLLAAGLAARKGGRGDAGAGGFAGACAGALAAAVAVAASRAVELGPSGPVRAAFAIAGWAVVGGVAAILARRLARRDAS